ncbi:hypothetical protein SDC9_200378 [bioreactor metagenome]|uniref:Uncharacterized protein n=1 Tax=bioreactor metagenome TaxID=1076179 RepID=A0A645INT8_9ZZZZ
MPLISSTFLSGEMMICFFIIPDISIIATCGNCSRRLRITLSANSPSSINFTTSVCSKLLSELRVRSKLNTGISVALALITRGRLISRGREFMAASIFSFTSINARSVLAPYSKLRWITALPSRVSLRISRNLLTCIN